MGRVVNIKNKIQRESGGVKEGGGDFYLSKIIIKERGEGKRR